MSRKLQSIYEYFSEYSEEIIDNVISNLSTEEKKLLVIRYGEDLHNPCPKEEWNNNKYRYQFYKLLLPKIRTLLEVEKEKDIVKENEENSKDIVQESIKGDPKEVEISSISTYTTYDLNNYKVLIDLINKNVSNVDICKQLNITFSELTVKLLELKNLGIACQKNYYSNGTIKYIPASELGSLSKSNNKNLEATIITDINEEEIKILATADFHYCNKLCRQDLVAKAFEYCVQNGIHIIMCAGDLLDGTFPPGNQTITEPYEQVKYFIENYPHDDSILTFAVGGNHDISVLNSSYIDLRYATTNYRPDIIIPGYANSIINIKNDKILLRHHVDNVKKTLTKHTILLHGHSHKFKIKDVYNNGPLEIWVPSLSNILQIMPTVLEMTLKFKNGIISQVTIKQVILENNPIVLGEYNYYKDNNLKDEHIFNTEDYKNGNVINQENKFGDDFERSTMSQIEKFNKRYKL